MTTTNPPPSPDRYQTIVGLLLTILKKVDNLERAVDEIDRTVLRPFGDGSKKTRR